MFYELYRDDLKKIIDVIIDYFKDNEKSINSLNVFPVPDGDTGTNMLLTLKSIREEVLKSKSTSIKSLMEKASFGALMGARGNSGVILSQILKGFFDGIIRSKSFDMETIRESLKSSRDLAYISVQNPTEGTMLTTIKDIHQYVENLMENDGDMSMVELMDRIIEEAEKSVERSTYLLPVLKQANVVDAGARGVLDILKGARMAFMEVGRINGSMKKKVERGHTGSNPGADSNTKSSGVEPAGNILPEGMTKKDVDDKAGQSGHAINRDLEEVKLKSEIKYTYCTEFIIKGNRINIERLREKIENYGDSALVVGNENFVKVHVHSNEPHRVLGRAIREGTLHEIKISNMKDQRMEVVKTAGQEEEAKESGRAMIAVSNGEGLEGIFKSLGVDMIVSGGQTMNPSTYDIVKAANSLNADEIIIFPNNKNIIATAIQTKRLVKKKNITVIPTRTIPEGISAVLNYNPDISIEENELNMIEIIGRSKCGEVTMAVRDANLLVGEIKKGEFIGLYNGKVRVVADSIVETTVELVRDIVDGTEEVITLYTGKDADSGDTKDIKEKLHEYFPEMDIEVHRGDQPLYPYIFSIE
ncbi:MAG: DAK2 domain-containing protein [Actinobacteria bacterium]|nr:DAK2 domain-containing protein [Actinomycetota bacterium]